MVGLLLGAGGQRSDRRLRDAGDVMRLTGLTVVGSLPATSGGIAEITSAGARAHARLRNLLTARAHPDTQVVLVAGVDGADGDVAALDAVRHRQCAADGIKRRGAHPCQVRRRHRHRHFGPAGPKRTT